MDRKSTQVMGKILGYEDPDFVVISESISIPSDSFRPLAFLGSSRDGDILGIFVTSMYYPFL